MNCLICLESTTFQVQDKCINHCKYYVHKECIQTWIDKEEKCIICKQKMNPDIVFNHKNIRKAIYRIVNCIVSFIVVYMIFDLTKTLKYRILHGKNHWRLYL